MMNIALSLSSVFAISMVGTALLRRYALARRVLDTPNERSSHAIPTPRGGGIAIAVAFFAGTVLLVLGRYVAPSTAKALIGGGTIVAAVGFLDDHREVAPRWRLLAHFFAAGWVLYWLGGLPSISLLGRPIGPFWVRNAIAELALVWLLNLYNFMDGIDGIAGIEAVTVSAGACALYALQPVGNHAWALPSVLAVATLGFLLWNFPSAKIFMGDSGSGFLGLMLGGLAVHSATLSAAWIWSWLILLGVFVVDATLTLLRRLRHRERLYEGHRNHAYQRAALRFGDHKPVTAAVAAINICWLLPLAILVGNGHLDGLLGALIGYAPLVWLAQRFHRHSPGTWATE